MYMKLLYMIIFITLLISYRENLVINDIKKSQDTSIESNSMKTILFRAILLKTILMRTILLRTILMRIIL